MSIAIKSFLHAIDWGPPEVQAVIERLGHYARYITKFGSYDRQLELYGHVQAILEAEGDYQRQLDMYGHVRRILEKEGDL